MSSSSKLFPLPPDFFRCPPLNVQERNHFLKMGVENCIDAVQYAKLNDGPVSWTLMSTHGKLSIYRGDDPDAPPGIWTICSHMKILATLDEVEFLFRSETAEEYDEYCYNFCQEALDSAILYTIAVPTLANPRQFIGIKWNALEFKHALKNRDFCFLESRSDFNDGNKRGWVRSLRSVELGCCPNLKATLDLVRAEHYRSSFTFVESNQPGYLEALQFVQVDLKGNLPSWIVKLATTRRAKGFGQIDHYLQRTRLSKTPLLPVEDLIPHNARSRCFLCRRRFGPFGAKCSCRKCGEVVCSNCSKLWEFKIDGQHILHVGVCTICISNVAESAGEKVQGTTFSPPAHTASSEGPLMEHEQWEDHIDLILGTDIMEEAVDEIYNNIMGNSPISSVSGPIILIDSDDET